VVVEQRNQDGYRHEELVVILSAGFSKAVHRALPTTDDLSERVREHLADATAGSCRAGSAVPNRSMTRPS
jgi:hypothetical protein